jgi:hypothetical protein
MFRFGIGIGSCKLFFSFRLNRLHSPLPNVCYTEIRNSNREERGGGVLLTWGGVLHYNLIAWVSFNPHSTCIHEEYYTVFQVQYFMFLDVSPETTSYKSLCRGGYFLLPNRE